MNKKTGFILSNAIVFSCSISAALLIFLFPPQSVAYGPIAILKAEKTIFYFTLNDTRFVFPRIYVLHTIVLYAMICGAALFLLIYFLRFAWRLLRWLPRLSGRYAHLISMLALFLVLVLLIDGVLFTAEWRLRERGYYPGSFYRWNDFSIENPHITKEVIASETGMTTYAPDSFPRKNAPPNMVINRQGFPTPINFDHASIDSLAGSGSGRKRKRLVLGDSFVEGIGASGFDKCFMELYRKRNPDQVTCAAGIRGADPVQYRLCAENLIPLIAPDVVCVMFCSWNDIMICDRKPIPYLPFFTDITGVGCIFNYIPPGVFNADTPVLTPIQAYHVYRKQFSLMENQDILSQACRRTAVTTRLYAQWAGSQLGSKGVLMDSTATYRNLKRIEELADSSGARFSIIFIPTPEMVAYDTKDYEAHYKWVFKDLWQFVHFCPKGMITESDCRSESDRHFNDRGQEKFAGFLQKEWNK